MAFNTVGGNDALRVANPGPAIRPVQGRLPAGHRVAGIGETGETMSKFTLIFDIF
jgi:hypothetical protein